MTEDQILSVSAEKRNPTRRAKRKPRKQRSSIYDALVKKLQALKKGEQLVIAPPEGVEPATFRNRLNYVLRTRVLPGMKGKPRFSMYVTEDYRVAADRVR